MKTLCPACGTTNRPILIGLFGDTKSVTYTGNGQCLACIDPIVMDTIRMYETSYLGGIK